MLRALTQNCAYQLVEADICLCSAENKYLDTVLYHLDVLVKADRRTSWHERADGFRTSNKGLVCKLIQRIAVKKIKEESLQLLLSDSRQIRSLGN